MDQRVPPEVLDRAERLAELTGRPVGEIFDAGGRQAPDSAEAMRMAHLDWRVLSEPLHLADGTEVPGWFATVRSDNREILGVVTGRYQVVQNVDAFGFMDSLLMDGIMRYESAMALRGGRTVVLLARMPSVDIIAENDQCLRYIMFSTSHDGTAAIHCLPTSVRVVCANTQRLAIQQGKARLLTIPHVGDVKGRLEIARQYLSQFDKAFTLFRDKAQLLAIGLKRGWIATIPADTANVGPDAKGDNLHGQTRAGRPCGDRAKEIAPDARRFARYHRDPQPCADLAECRSEAAARASFLNRWSWRGSTAAPSDCWKKWRERRSQQPSREDLPMLCLNLQASFGVFRTFTAGSYRPTAGFITPSAAYGLLLNVAGIEMRHDDGKSPMTLIAKGLPIVRIAIGALEFPLQHSLYQQLHNYPVGTSGKERSASTKGNKYNITPVRRAVLSNIRAYICLEGNDSLEAQVQRGLAGQGPSRYGVPFLGDNNFLLDRLESVERMKPAYWFTRVKPSDQTFRDRTTRLTVVIDRADM